MARIGPFTIVTLRDVDLALKQIGRGLLDLTFDDNFSSKVVTVTIPAGGEVSVSNPFMVGIVPREWVIVDRLGDGDVKRGSANWGVSLSFANSSATDDVTATIRLFR